MEGHKILIASDGGSAILVVNGKVCDAESFIFKATPTDVTLDITGMDVTHLNGGLPLFAEYVKTSLGYKLPFSNEHGQNGFMNLLKKL